MEHGGLFNVKCQFTDAAGVAEPSVDVELAGGRVSGTAASVAPSGATWFLDTVSDSESEPECEEVVYLSKKLPG